MRCRRMFGRPASWRHSETALPKPPASTFSSRVMTRGMRLARGNRVVRSSGLANRRLTTVGAMP